MFLSSLSHFRIEAKQQLVSSESRKRLAQFDVDNVTNATELIGRIFDGDIGHFRIALVLLVDNLDNDTRTF